MVRRLLSVLFVALAFSGAACAQKALKQLRAYIKDKNTAEAQKLIGTLTKDSAVTHLPRLYDLAKEVYILVNDAENEKVYLKQSYDTAQFFNSILEIYRNVLKCEYEEQRQLAEKGGRMKYHNANSIVLHRYYANINAGGRYFYSRKNYAATMEYVRYFLDVPHTAIWAAVSGAPEPRSSAVVTNAYIYIKSAWHSKQYAEAERYKSIVLADTSIFRRSSIELLALSAGGAGDTTAYRNYLELGIRAYPGHPFFFTHLADLYAKRGQYGEVLALSEQNIARDSSNVLALEARSLALMNLQRYGEAIGAAQKCIAVDSTLADAYYYIGASYCGLAQSVVLPGNINSKAYRTALADQKKYYKLALPYMEKYRVKAVDRKRRWLPLLYRIYFALNMGKQFDEMENLLKSETGKVQTDNR